MSQGEEKPEVLRLMADTGRSYGDCERALNMTGYDHWDAECLLWVDFEPQPKKDDGSALW